MIPQRVWLFVTPWIVACQAPLSMGILQARILELVAISFSRKKVWSEWSEWSVWSEVAQPCLTLCDPTDCSLPGSSLHGIFQARVLEWVAIAFSSSSEEEVKGLHEPFVSLKKEKVKPNINLMPKSHFNKFCSPTFVMDAKSYWKLSKRLGYNIVSYMLQIQ